MHCAFIAFQILVLRKDYRPIQLLQLPVAFLFGFLTDFGVWALQGVTHAGYVQQWILCLVGTALVGAGVSLEVRAGVVVLAGEGAVLALCKALPVKFGTMKVGFDVTLVATACIVSFAGLGHLEGVREGTVAAALLVGPIARKMGDLWERLRPSGTGAQPPVAADGGKTPRRVGAARSSLTAERTARQPEPTARAE